MTSLVKTSGRNSIFETELRPDVNRKATECAVFKFKILTQIVESNQYKILRSTILIVVIVVKHI